MADVFLRTRVWLDGELVVDDAITADSVASAYGHLDLVDEAARAGRRWLVEVSDPDGELDPVRFGSDAGGMVDPRPVDLRDLTVLGIARARGEA